MNGRHWCHPDLPRWVQVAGFERELARARAAEEFVRGRLYGARVDRHRDVWSAERRELVPAAWEQGWGEGFAAGWHAGVEAGLWRARQDWMDEIRAERRSPASVDWLARFGLEGRAEDGEEAERRGLAG